MALIQGIKINNFILRTGTGSNLSNIYYNKFHVSSIQQLDQKWRKKNRFTQNPNAFGPLTNLPDYSFADGRPVPFGVRQMTRINKQRQYFTKIKQLASEVDYAVERYNRIQNELTEKKKSIIDSKLKPKGQKYLAAAK
ncbi:GSCOCG00009481001-RA-CDS [Cotesia congregata]|uniref:Large ribosomal subunit protein mL52 n=1 Tax=Cotesia congregata TaxID=51543 RepID=A0A8J2MK24_COTCN|nr:GSCOCG00009481001-RA-CDS [Cotesia congregata]CAG5088857.1 Similar to mRpL52: 39S ribosomal protein L52 [Cotesia congregata]